MIRFFLLCFCFVGLVGCTQATRTPISENLLRDCSDWPSSQGRQVEMTRDLLDLAREGRLAHADCQARYDALRGAVRPR